MCNKKMPSKRWTIFPRLTVWSSTPMQPSTRSPLPAKNSCAQDLPAIDDRDRDSPSSLGHSVARCRSHRLLLHLIAAPVRRSDVNEIRSGSGRVVSRPYRSGHTPIDFSAVLRRMSATKFYCVHWNSQPCEIIQFQFQRVRRISLQGLQFAEILGGNQLAYRLRLTKYNGD